MNAKFAVSTYNSTLSFSIKPSEHVTTRPEAVCRGKDDSNISDNTQRPKRKPQRASESQRESERVSGRVREREGQREGRDRGRERERGRETGAGWLTVCAPGASGSAGGGWGLAARWERGE